MCKGVDWSHLVLCEIVAVFIECESVAIFIECVSVDWIHRVCDCELDS